MGEKDGEEFVGVYVGESAPQSVLGLRGEGEWGLPINGDSFVGGGVRG